MHRNLYGYQKQHQRTLIHLNHHFSPGKCVHSKANPSRIQLAEKASIIFPMRKQCLNICLVETALGITGQTDPNRNPCNFSSSDQKPSPYMQLLMLLSKGILQAGPITTSRPCRKRNNLKNWSLGSVVIPLYLHSLPVFFFGWLVGWVAGFSVYVWLVGFILFCFFLTSTEFIELILFYLEQVRIKL